MLFKKRFSLVIILIVTTLGCDSNQRSAITKTTDWSRITIVSEENLVITLNNSDDTTLVKFYNTGGFFTGYHKLKVDSSSVYFTLMEKGLIYKLSDSIINVAVSPKSHCTDFVGDLKLVIDYGSFKKQIEYSGVCDWGLLSKQTSQLNKILEKKGVFKSKKSSNE